MVPPCPPEIVQKILIHLHRVDLLNCRLVSQSWNKESIRALGSSKYLLNLSETNLGEYIEFSKQSSMKALLMMMPFSWTLTFDISKSSEPSAIEKFNETLSKVETLLGLYGPECVCELRLHINTDAQQLIPLSIELLSNVCQGLEKLVISIDAPLGPSEDFFKHFPDLTFPKVEYLYMMSSTVNINNIFWSNLATKCPNVVDVQILGFPSDPLEANWPINSSLTKVKTLVSIMLPLSYISSKICGTSSLSNLTWLQLGIIGSFTTIPSGMTYLKNVLEHLSTTLVGLDFIFYGSTSPIPADSIVIPCTRFQRLKNLRLLTYLKTADTNYPTLKLEPSAFPALELIKLPYYVKVEVINTNEIVGTDDIFPKVQSLELCVCDDVGLIPTEPYKNHMEDLQNIFKNVSKVSVSNYDRNFTYDNGQSGGGIIKYVLEGIIQSAKATQITQLTLENCHENFLGMILNQIYKPPRIVIENLPRNFFLDGTLKKTLQKFTGGMDFIVIDQNDYDRPVVVQQCTQNLKDNFNLHNLKKVRLILNSNTENIWNSCIIPSSDDSASAQNLMDTPRELFVKTMVQNFPPLEEIEVSSFMFGKCTKTRSEILQQIGKEFPNIVIDVI